MNIQQMHIGVDLGVQKVNSNAFDDLLPEEKNYYLNRAQREYIRRQTAYLREDIEDISRPDLIRQSEVFDNLSTVIIKEYAGSLSLTPDTGFENAITIPYSELSDTIFSFGYAQAKESSSEEWKACKPISTSEIHMYTDTKYNSPVFRKFPIVRTNSGIMLFYDSSSTGISDFVIMYIKTPLELIESGAGTDQTTESELPEHTHDDVVDIAINMILGDLNPSPNRTIKGEEEG